MRRLIKKSQKLVKGAPTAVVVAIVFHAALFFLAGLLVVFTVVTKKEPVFEQVQAVVRPKMKLRKPKVKVTKSSKPKTTRIVTKMNRASMPDIQIPEVSDGMGVGGLGGGLGGFDMMPSLDDISVFGGGQSIGNDFVGILYDLKRGRQGRDIPMGRDQFVNVIRKFARGGWKSSDLARYYQSPKELYTTHFMIPPIPSSLGPDKFGAPETSAYFFFVKYKGKLVYKEDIKFRFWGSGDAYFLVRVNGKNVFIAGNNNFYENRFLWWQSSSADDYKYVLGSHPMVVGDWVELKAGEPVDMEALFGEWEGGVMGAMLLVEVDGVDYPKTRQGGPLLPAFKTEDFTLDMREEIRKWLPEGECTLTNGPVFRDY